MLFPVLIGYSSVQLQSFSGFVTGLPNTSHDVIEIDSPYGLLVPYFGKVKVVRLGKAWISDSRSGLVQSLPLEPLQPEPA